MPAKGCYTAPVTLEEFLSVAGLHIPNTDGAIGTATGDALTIGAKPQRPDPALVTRQYLLGLTTSNIPQADGMVFTTAGQTAVRRGSSLLPKYC